MKGTLPGVNKAKSANSLTIAEPSARGYALSHFHWSRNRCSNSNRTVEHTRIRGNKVTISITKATVSNQASTRAMVDSSNSKKLLLLSQIEYL